MPVDKRLLVLRVGSALLGISLVAAVGGRSILIANSQPAAGPEQEKKEGDSEGALSSNYQKGDTSRHSNEGQTGQKSEGAAGQVEERSLTDAAKAKEQAETQSTAPARGSSPAKPTGHVITVEMKISGSMCLACLHELEKKLKEIPGMSKARIEYPGDNYYNAYLQTVAASFARATLSYDPGLVSLDNIKAMLRTQGYFAFKIVEKGK